MTRYTKNPEDLSLLINSAAGSFAKIAEKSKLLSTFSTLIKQTCPDLPEESFVLANMKADIIVIEAKSPVWAQRLQFERNTILRAVQQASGGLINKIEIKINPKAVINKPALIEKPKKQLSENAAEHIVALAESAPDSLKEKLMRLASHVNNTKQK
jgi:hypothetical protein